MKDNFDLIAELREDQGKGASRRLRHKGKVPAIIYGAGRPPRSLMFDQNKVLKKLENESFYSSILNIKVGEKSQAAILKDLQRHPAKHMIMHMDFQRIVDDVEIKMNIPFHFLGEDVAPGVKDGGGSVSHLMNDVEVSCFNVYANFSIRRVHNNSALNVRATAVNGKATGRDSDAISTDGETA